MACDGYVGFATRTRLSSRATVSLVGAIVQAFNAKSVAVTAAGSQSVPTVHICPVEMRNLENILIDCISRSGCVYISICDSDWSDLLSETVSRHAEIGRAHV